MTPQSLPTSLAGSCNPGNQAEGMLAALLAATVGPTGKATTSSEGFESLFLAPAEADGPGNGTSPTLSTAPLLGTAAMPLFACRTAAVATPTVELPAGVGNTDAETTAPEVAPSALLSFTYKGTKLTSTTTLGGGTSGPAKPAGPGKVQNQSDASGTPVSSDPAIGITATPPALDPQSDSAPVTAPSEKRSDDPTQPTESAALGCSVAAMIVSPGPVSAAPATGEPTTISLPGSTPEHAAGPITDGTVATSTKSKPGTLTQAPVAAPSANTNATINPRASVPVTAGLTPQNGPTDVATSTPAAITSSTPGSPLASTPVAMPKATSVSAPISVAGSTPGSVAGPTLASTPGSTPAADTRVQSDAVSTLPTRSDRPAGTATESPGAKVPAKFTQLPTGQASTPAAAAEIQEKTNLTSRYSTANKTAQALGTDTAFQSAPMPAATQQRRSSLAESKEDFRASGLSLESGLKDTAVALPREPVPAASQALATVLKIVNQPDKPERTHVDLQFSFGRDTLSVRVGMNAGQVQTVFQTSSNELRTALVNQWQDFVAHTPESVRAVADPVFNSVNSALPNFAQNDASSGRHPAQQFEEQFHAQNPAATSTEAESQEPIIPQRPGSGSIGRQLLNTLA